MVCCPNYLRLDGIHVCVLTLFCAPCQLGVESNSGFLQSFASPAGNYPMRCFVALLLAS